LFTNIRTKLPWVNRVSLYGNAKAIRNKSVEQLLELKSLGLHRVYMGLESGYDPVLTAIHKGADSAEMIEAGQRVKAANLFLSVTALLGIAGAALSQEHAKATGQVLSAMEPNQTGILTLMLLENTQLYQLEQAGEFNLPTQQEMLAELRTMVEHLNLKKGQLQSNHASNYLAINARMPRDKEAVLAAIDQALDGKTRLKPEYLRAL
ncbi:MAG: radical SAM protein, partial [Proteobacteria bacterium]|nr:radical SAM protein [Pseudomonadota bacterium]